MRFPNNVVTLEDTRSGYPGSVGVPTHCLYCKAATGGPHAHDCVVIHRPVKVRVTMELIISEPRSWDADKINFRLNESTWCAENILDDIQRQVAAMGCPCSFSQFEYVEDATLEEAIEAGLKPDSETDVELSCRETTSLDATDHAQ